MAFTYATLTDALQAWPEDDNPDFTANLDTIIGLGELQLLRDLDIEYFEATGTISTAGSSNILTKPAGYIALRTLDYTSNGILTYVHPRTVEYVKDYGGNGNPLYAAELNESQWLVAPTPTVSLTINVRYTKRPLGLSSTNSTTWLGTNVPDALLYACLVCAEEYLKSDERLPVWKQKYRQEILPAAKHELQKSIKANYHP